MSNQRTDCTEIPEATSAASSSHSCAHGSGHSHSHGGSATSSAAKAETPAEPNAGALLATRVGLLGLVGFVLFITISFCTGVYYDRESAFRNALACSESVLGEAKVQHWLQNGTLLGATRLGRLVLWDADLDYGFLATTEALDLPALSAALDEKCFGYSATQRAGAVHPKWSVWRKCTRRLCAEFHQAALVTREGGDGAGKEYVVTGDGASPATEMFPLANCRVADVDSVCPHNAAYFLAQAYGSEWLTTPLTKLF